MLSIEDRGESRTKRKLHLCFHRNGPGLLSLRRSPLCGCETCISYLDIQSETWIFFQGVEAVI